MPNLHRRESPPSRRAPWLVVLAIATASATAGDPEVEPIANILEAAHSFLTDAIAPKPGSETEVEIGQLDSRLRLAHCDKPLSAQFAPGARAQGNTTINVRCPGPVTWSVFVPAKIRLYREVVVAARPIARQQIIGASDLQLQRFDTSRLALGYLEDAETVIGKQAKRPIAAGQVVTQVQVKEPKMVERGHLVTLISGRPGLMVKMTGEAMEDGALGQRIRVRNRSSKRVVEGTVESSGRVRIAL